MLPFHAEPFVVQYRTDYHKAAAGHGTSGLGTEVELVRWSCQQVPLRKFICALS